MQLALAGKAAAGWQLRLRCRHREDAGFRGLRRHSWLPRRDDGDRRAVNGGRERHPEDLPCDRKESEAASLPRAAGRVQHGVPHRSARWRRPIDRGAQSSFRTTATAVRSAWSASTSMSPSVRRAEDHQRVLAAELDHRVKNVLAVVSAVAAQHPRCEHLDGSLRGGIRRAHPGNGIDARAAERSPVARHTARRAAPAPAGAILHL